MPTPPETSETSRPPHISTLLFCALTFLFALALVSYSPADISSYSSDASGQHFAHNLLGLFGAYVIWALFLTFGLGTYAAFCLLVVITARRFFCRDTLRPLTFLYFLAYLLFVVSSAMLAATWHEHFSAHANALNLATLAGGVLGDAICGPHGFLLYVFNRVGISIFMGLTMLGALAYLYFSDWHPLFMAWQLRHAAEKPAPPEPTPEPAPEPLPQVSVKVQPAPPPPPPAPKKTPPPAPKPTPAPRPVAPPPPAGDGTSYVLPPIELLVHRETDAESEASRREIQNTRNKLQGVLDAFNIEGTVVDAVHGPQVTLFKIKLEPHVRVDRITSLEHNICMDLASSRIRILTPIPNESFIGIEVPNATLQSVSIRTMVEEKEWQTSKQQLPMLLGKNISGNTICIDLASAPHLLIAGTTGTGKSVCMNMLIVSLLYKHTPETLRLILVDPKKVEFSIYRRLPHLLVPVITDNSKVALALRWACNEMTRRYQLLSVANARNITTYNNNRDHNPELRDENDEPLPATLPYIVIVIDELADIMLTSKAEVEDCIARLAALARAVGIHLILATQRPDTKVITGTIKNNLPVRISFQVASHIDSQTIIGQKGAERLLGKGDMLYKPTGGELQRIQGGMASDEERNAVVEYITANSPAPQFDATVLQDANDASGLPEDDVSKPRGKAAQESDEDTLFDRAVDIILNDRKASISYLQRRLGIGYNKSATLVEELEKQGIIGPKLGTANAEILITREEWEQRKAAPRGQQQLPFPRENSLAMPEDENDLEPTEDDTTVTATAP